MKSKTMTHTTGDGAKIFVYTWLPEKKKYKGIIHIIHGMADHAGRYERFARELTDNHYIVYAHDQRGHGKTAECGEDFGYLGENKSCHDLVKDVHELTQIIRKNHPELPLFHFSHSFGTYISLGYIEEHGKDIEGCIFSGPGIPNKLLLTFGKIILKNEMKKHGEKYKSEKVNSLSFGAFNKPFKPNRTGFDWLNRDTNEVDVYIQDPRCGFICSVGFYWELSAWLNTIYKKKHIALIPDTLPLYLCAGEKDPVGNMGKDILRLVKMYKKAGIKDLTYKLYPESRHEIINEINREQVIKDILTWLEGHVK
ncbi:MAG: alpha/beta hydrolase [Spirochaetales bacterium]|nr:alpha/beta hydrolase [Spirochaetales bacterium]